MSHRKDRAAPAECRGSVTAGFDLTQPIVLNGAPADGETVSATAVGDLTLHGLTRSISIPLQG